MQFLGVENRVIANHIACLVDGLISQRAFDADLVTFSDSEPRMKQLGDR